MGLHSLTNQITENIRSTGRIFSVAGVVGFEPTNGGTRTRCLTTWRHPSGVFIITHFLGKWLFLKS